MKIIHFSAEFAPLAKAGGLGDVLVGLCRAHTLLEQECAIVLPKYDFIDLTKVSGLKIELDHFSVEESGAIIQNTAWSCICEDCKVYLIETQHPKKYFSRGLIYGAADDTARFLYFCKAALEFLKAKKISLDILQMHDWHTVATSIFLKSHYKLPIQKTIFTIHNAEHQGICASWDLDAIGLDGKRYSTKDLLQDKRYPEALNLMKGGLIFSDAIVTVSPTYSKEVLLEENSGPISETFQKYSHKLVGILNGIDFHIWNPQNDEALLTPYDKSFSEETILFAKESAKQQVRKRFFLDNSKRPWIGSITRIVPQKGPDLIEKAIQTTIENDGCFILIGSSPIPDIQKHFNALKKKYDKNPQVLLHFEYTEIFAHQVYASLDFLLMPSYFEPCGLSQLIAMRYGAIPIVRQTGGLNDTVRDLQNPKIPEELRNGFVFKEKSKFQTEEAVLRALDFYKNSPQKFAHTTKKVMNFDFSWEKPAEKYLELYEKLLSSSDEIHEDKACAK